MAANYKKLLTDLYLRYNESKVGEVDELLRRFKGREKELIYKVYLKYGPPETREEVKEKLDRYFEEQNAEPVPKTKEIKPVERRERRRPNTRRIAVVAIALALVGGLTYGGWRVAQGDWEFFASGENEVAALPTPQFVLANAVYARNQCEAGEKTDNFLRYGEALTNYEEAGNCFLSKSDSNPEALYYPSQYFVTEDKFREIDAIFGNDAARSQIKHSYEKRALRLWFRHNGIIGKLSPEWKDSIAGKDRNPEVWQVFAESEPSELNTWARGEFSEASAAPFTDTPEDLVCIIRKAGEPKRQKLLYFSFNSAQESEIHEAFDLSRYPDRLIRDFPREGDDWTRFFQRITDAPFHQGILLEDPEGKLSDYLLLWKGDHFSIFEEIPRDTLRIPGLPPIIL